MKRSACKALVLALFLSAGLVAQPGVANAFGRLGTQFSIVVPQEPDRLTGSPAMLIDPADDFHGADAVRWFMAATGSPWLPRRIGHSALQEIVRKVLLTYWNTVAFQSLYARASDWSPADEAPPVAERTSLDTATTLGKRDSSRLSAG